MSVKKEMKINCTADHFQENITELLWERNLTQTELADMVGVPPSSVNNWVKGRCEPNLFAFANLCNALNVSPEWFLRKNRFVNFDQ